MEEKSFLPDKRPVRAHILAQLSLPRESIELIAQGAKTDDQHAFGNPTPVWGLLYMDDTSLGFFVHPSDNYMGFAFRTSRDSNQSEPIDLVIPFEQIMHKEILHPKTPKTWLGKLLSRFILMGDHICVISWKSDESTNTLRFNISTDPTSFESELQKR